MGTRYMGLGDEWEATEVQFKRGTARFENTDLAGDRGCVPCKLLIPGWDFFRKLRCPLGARFDRTIMHGLTIWGARFERTDRTI